jgi:RNA polymerase sigma-70 factor (ECF subfamily)
LKSPPAVALTDIDLVAQAVGDNHDAFAELVRRYQSPLRAWLRRLTNGDDAWADDLAQESFLRAYRRLRSFRGDGTFSAWLFGIAYNQFRNELRRRRTFVEIHELEESVTDDSNGANAEYWGDLDSAIQTLSVEQRAAITLCFQQGMTHEEAAAVLKCPLGTVKTNILRAKARLRRYFSAATVN